MKIRYLHTMVRVKDLEKSMAFFALLGLKETRRHDSEQGRFTLIFMAPEVLVTSAVVILDTTFMNEKMAASS